MMVSYGVSIVRMLGNIDWIIRELHDGAIIKFHCGCLLDILW